MSITRNARFRNLLVAVPAAAFAVLSCAAAKADMYLYHVTIPTDPLNALTASGPYSMLFELTDGSGLGDSNNTVTLTNFNVGSAAPVALTDSEPLVYDVEQFTPIASPGSTLSFDLSTTNNFDAGGTPDEFSFFILDGTSTPLITTDELSSSLFTVDLGGDQPVVTTFESMGGFAGIDPALTSYTIVPEPSSTAALWGGIIGTCGFLLKRRRGYCPSRTR